MKNIEIIDATPKANLLNIGSDENPVFVKPEEIEFVEHPITDHNPINLSTND
jgi:hypothetical protein